MFAVNIMFKIIIIKINFHRMEMFIFANDMLLKISTDIHDIQRK